MIPERIGDSARSHRSASTPGGRAPRGSEPRIADLSYANFDGPLDPAVREVLQQALATDRSLAFQYTPFGGSRTARQAVAEAPWQRQRPRARFRVA